MASPLFTEDGEEPSAINEYVSNILDMWQVSPFESRDLTTTSPDQMATLVENTFYSPTSIKRAMTYRPINGDVVIAGSPRCGQTPLLKMVDNMLLWGPDHSSSNLSSRIPWIESVAFDNVPPGPSIDGRRVFKTHVSLSALKPHMKPGVKYVSVVRDPVDLRLSFYRHLRKIYIASGQHEVKQKFDEFYSKDDFARVLVAPYTLGQSGNGAYNGNSAGQKVAENLFGSADATVYEHDMLAWIDESEKNPEQVMVVFYEELVTNPKLVAEKLVKFLGAPNTDLTRVVESIKVYEYPSHIVKEIHEAAKERAEAAGSSETNNKRAESAIAKTVAEQSAFAPGSVGGPKPPPKPKEEVKLPPGWKIGKDASGEKFYYNKKLDKVQWNAPKEEDATEEDDYDNVNENLSCLNRGHKLFNESSISYIDEVWDFVVTRERPKTTTYEQLYFQYTGYPYPFEVRERKKDNGTRKKKGGRWFGRR